jgi:imidazolonepropionase-like amidohydrolase
VRVLVLLVAVSALATPLAANAATVAIVGGTVYPVSSAPIKNGTVIITDGKITAVGANLGVPAGAQRIDATGKTVTPGLIDAYTQVGLLEIEEQRETRDTSSSNHIAPSFTPWDGFNTASVIIPPTRDEGVTNVVIAPSGGLISGQAAMLTLRAGNARALLEGGPAGIVVQFDNPQAAGASSRGELIGKLRALLGDVRLYAGNRAKYEGNALRTLGAAKADLDALVPVVQGRLPLLVDAESVDQIESALQFARDEHLKIILVGGAEAWLVASDLARAHVPVLSGAMNNIPNSFSTLNSRQETPALLRRAGVTVVLVSSDPGGDSHNFNARNIKYEAGNAVAYGMSHDDALRAITLTPAEVFGVADRLGSLAPGRNANVVVWSGDPFEFATRVEHVFVDGRELHERTRQDLLTERYRTLPSAKKNR